MKLSDLLSCRLTLAGALSTAATLLLPLAGQAATLAELQQLALNNRAVIARYQADYAVSEKNTALARSNYYPDLDVSYSLNNLDQATAFENRENSVAYGAITWNLFAGFQDKYAVAAAERQQQSAQHQLNGIRQDIQLNVALRYLAIFDRRAQLTVAEDSFTTLEKIYRDAQNRFQVGLIKKNELLRFKIDLDNATITTKRSQAELQKSINLLQREIAAPVPAQNLAFSEFESLPALENSEAYTARLDHRSEVRVLEELLLAAEAQVKAEYGRLAPKLDLTGSYRKYNDDFGPGNSGYDQELRTQLVLSMNLFDGFNKYHQVSKAKLLSQSIRYDLEELRRDLKTELQNRFQDYEVSRENAAVALTSITQAEENLRISTLSYQEGLEKESDLLDAIANLSRARSNYVLAKSEVFQNYFQITRAVDGF